MTKRKSKYDVLVETTVGDAVDTAYGELNTLGEELREAADNMPENLQGGDLYDRRTEAADTLEGFSEIDVPEFLQHLPVKFETRRNPRASRADRCAEAVQYLRTAQEVVESLNELDPKESGTERPEGWDQGAVDAFLDELTTMIDDAEAVEFPGMFG